MLDLGVLCCPACGGALTADAEAVRCRVCSREYPLVNGVLDFLTPPSHDSDRDGPTRRR
jgi:uncharacterized protein YbaR (Trm112 family)